MSMKGGRARVEGPHRRNTATRAKPWAWMRAFRNWVVPSITEDTWEGPAGGRGKGRGEAGQKGGGIWVGTVQH